MNTLSKNLSKISRIQSRSYAIEMDIGSELLVESDTLLSYTTST